MRTSQSVSQPYLPLFFSFLAGVLFAVGLGVSGMTDPKKVIGFLDVTGDWQPTLLYVMVGAISVYTVANFVSMKLPKPIVAPDWTELPKPGPDLSWPARVGNLFFGVGWGLAGYCPGPALASLPALHSSTWIFAAFMIAGFLFWDLWASKFLATNLRRLPFKKTFF